VVKECRERTPDVTVAEILQVVHLKGPGSSKAKKPTGHLRTSVVQFCEGNSFQLWRQRIRQAEEHEARQRAEQDARQQRYEAELETIGRAEEVWESLTATDKAQRVGQLLSEFQRRYGQKMTAEQIARNAEQAAKTQFVREYVERVGITEVA
jgi:uncharacterized protein YdiU (UPF0061 family)